MEEESRSGASKRGAARRDGTCQEEDKAERFTAYARGSLARSRRNSSFAQGSGSCAIDQIRSLVGCLVAAVGALEFVAIRRKRRFGREVVVEQTGVFDIGVLEVRLAIYALQHPGSHKGTHREPTPGGWETDVPGKDYFLEKN
jgi:hypothetical protein